MHAFRSGQPRRSLVVYRFRLIGATALSLLVVCLLRRRQERLMFLERQELSERSVPLGRPVPRVIRDQ
jgi:hypothetical protein